MDDWLWRGWPTTSCVVYPVASEEAAIIEEHAAWHRSYSYEQGKWRRVRKVICRRLIAGELPPA
jgi:hypothetical protein